MVIVGKNDDILVTNTLKIILLVDVNCKEDILRCLDPEMNVKQTQLPMQPHAQE